MQCVFTGSYFEESFLVQEGVLSHEEGNQTCHKGTGIL